jgi:hypothetical protein
MLLPLSQADKWSMVFAPKRIVMPGLVPAFAKASADWH